MNIKSRILSKVHYAACMGESITEITYLMHILLIEITRLADSNILFVSKITTSLSVSKVLHDSVKIIMGLVDRKVV